MSTFTFDPAPGAVETTTPRVRTAKYGDGYEQRILEGINALPRKWALTFTRATSDVDAVVAFLDARAGVDAFTWLPPRGASGEWVCREYSVSMLDTVGQTVSATFEQVFE